MTGMPETAKNAPDPAGSGGGNTGGRVLRWPHNPPETRVSTSLLSTVIAWIAAQGGGEGLFPTPIETLHIVSSFETRMPMRQVYRPSLCIALQGAKEIMLGDDIFRYGAMECLVVGLDLPASGRVVEASADAPYIGMTLDLDMAIMRDVQQHLETPPMPSSGPGPCLFVATADQSLSDCLQRLVRLLQTPGAIPILYPAIMRELCYWLLTSPNGGELRNLALPESNSERVGRVIHMLHANFAQTLRIEQLAEAARMSASSFHQHFKALTSMTPLQYQKQLRLLEARRVMVTEAVSVAEAAYQVGYESPSQFSREYSRMFGVAPKQDVLKLQLQYRAYADRKSQTA